MFCFTVPCLGFLFLFFTDSVSCFVSKGRALCDQRTHFQFLKNMKTNDIHITLKPNTSKSFHLYIYTWKRLTISAHLSSCELQIRVYDFSFRHFGAVCLSVSVKVKFHNFLARRGHYTPPFSTRS